MNREEERLLRARAERGESLAEAIRNHEVDAVVGRDQVLLLNLSNRDDASLLANLPDVIYRLDRDLRVVRVSPIVELYTGLESGHFLRRTPREAGLAPELWEQFESVCRRLLETGEAQELESLLETAQGTRFLHTRLFAEKDADGVPQAILGVTADATERHRAEEALRRSEERLAAALQGAALGTWEFNLGTGQCSHWSERMAELFALPRPPGGMNCTEAVSERVHPDDRERFASAFAAMRLRGRLDVTLRLLRPMGGDRWVRLAGHRVRRGEPDESIVGIAEDVSLWKEAESRLARAKDAAERANASKSAFLANMSHEIRTPMTAILGYAEVLRDEVQGELAKEYLECIAENGNLLIAIVNDVLDLSKIEAGKVSLERKVFELAPVVEGVVELMRATADGKGLGLRATFSPGVPSGVVCDPTRLKQILLNLLSNAVKFTRTGAVTLEVSVSPGEEALVFAVHDTGPGVDPSFREHLFQPFEQGGASASAAGTGLGLAISHRLARLLGGTVALDRSGPEGSTFVLRLPLERPDEAPAEDDGASTAGPFLSGREILVVDDQSDIREILDRFLSRLGARVVCAEDGATARAEVRTALDRFDLILLDLRLPDIDGQDLARLLRQDGLQSPIIAITAHAMDADRVACLEAGCTDFLIKPVHYEVLRRKLRDLLEA